MKKVLPASQCEKVNGYARLPANSDKVVYGDGTDSGIYPPACTSGCFPAVGYQNAVGQSKHVFVESEPIYAPDGTKYTSGQVETEPDTFYLLTRCKIESAYSWILRKIG